MSTKTKKASRGELGRQQGLEFEEVLSKTLNNPGKLREDLLTQIKPELPRGSKISDWHFLFTFIPHNQYFPSYTGKQSPAKTDIILMASHKKNHKKVAHFKFSVKKTKHRTQVHITSVDCFFKLMKTIFKVSASPTVIKAYKKFCGVSGFTPNDFLSKKSQNKLAQKNRQRYLLNELTPLEQKAIQKWTNKYRRQIIELVLQRGSVIDPQTHATHYLCFNGSYQGGKITGNNPLIVSPIKKVIKEALQEPVRFSKEFGCICLGANLELQMKGSGDSRAAKTQLQVQKRIV